MPYFIIYTIPKSTNKYFSSRSMFFGWPLGGRRIKLRCPAALVGVGTPDWSLPSRALNDLRLRLGMGRKEGTRRPPSQRPSHGISMTMGKIHAILDLCIFVNLAFLKFFKYMNSVKQKWQTFFSLFLPFVRLFLPPSPHTHTWQVLHAWPAEPGVEQASWLCSDDQPQSSFALQKGPS